MIKTIVAIDEQDEILGEFFNECLCDLENFQNDKCAMTFIKSNALNDLSISLTVPKNEKFVFLAYSHGADSELLANGRTPYISDSLNTTLFKSALFYTCSCFTGKKLGQLLIDNECISYIGYKEKFEVWDFNREPFVACANYGFRLFTEGHSVEIIIQKMKAKYDEQIDNYTNDFFGAAHLLANKNALISLGNLENCLAHMSN